MAAILVPSPHHPVEPARRPDPRPQLRIVHGGAGDRPGAATPAAVYRRRRLVAAVVAVAVLSVAGATARAALAPLAEPAPAGPAAASAAAGRTVVVQPGDTVWTIARRAEPTGDIRPLVDRLVAAHGSTPLQPGDTIVIPD